VLEKQRYHFIHYIGSIFGYAPEGSARFDEPIVEDKNDKSMLDAFNLEFDDISPMHSHEYEAALKNYNE
jgi:hypothetical protein